MGVGAVDADLRRVKVQCYLTCPSGLTYSYEGSEKFKKNSLKTKRAYAILKDYSMGMIMVSIIFMVLFKGQGKDHGHYYGRGKI